MPALDPINAERWHRFEGALLVDAFDIQNRTENNVRAVDITGLYLTMAELYVSMTHYIPSFRMYTLRWAFGKP